MSSAKVVPFIANGSRVRHANGKLGRIYGGTDRYCTEAMSAKDAALAVRYFVKWDDGSTTEERSYLLIPLER